MRVVLQDEQQFKCDDDAFIRICDKAFFCIQHHSDLQSQSNILNKVNDTFVEAEIKSVPDLIPRSIVHTIKVCL